MPTPVVVVDSGGLGVTNLAADGAWPLTVVSDAGFPITIISDGGIPVTLLNEDGTFWSAVPVTDAFDFSDANNSEYVPLLEDI